MNTIVTKICKKCGETKGIELFPKYGKRIENTCKHCKYLRSKAVSKDSRGKASKKFYSLHKQEYSEKFKRYYQDNKEKIAAKRSEYFQQNKDVIVKRVAKYYDENKSQILQRAKIYRSTHKSQDNLSKRIGYNKYRKDFLDLYGNKCACCGETNTEFLTIEHKLGQVGKKKESSHKAYRNAVKNFDPNVYEILCMNCNFSKGKYGYCPHESRTS